jgi:drug/metabolite transporter (DMT)-like permease
MSFGIFLAVLFAAFLHASWNALLKFGSDKLQGMVLLSMAHGVIGFGMVLAFPAPDPKAWGWLSLSVCFHVWYKFFLMKAYEKGDLSRVYPIARGAAPMIVLAISWVFLSDQMTSFEVFGILTVGFGILLLARGVFTNGEATALLPLALASALGTAGYSIADGMGARASGHASGFVGWLFMLDAILFTLWGVWVRGRSVIPRPGPDLYLGFIAGFGSVGAYWIAVVAMTKAPIALIATLRETSVLFAVAIGILIMGDRADRGKIIAAGVIVIGVVLMRL